MFSLISVNAGSMAVAQTLSAPCVDPTTCEIEFDHLSNQQTEPFRVVGFVIEEDSELWAKYGRAIREYADVEDCLPAVAGAYPSPMAFSWSGPRDLHGVEVCLFRIAASLRDPAAISVWLSSYGFRGGGVSPHFADPDNSDYDTLPTRSMSAGIPAKEFYALRPNWLHSTFGLTIAHSASVNISWNHAGELAGAQVLLNTE